MSQSPLISVEIFGRTYQLRSNDDPEYVESLAKMVHDKMVEVDRTTNTVDSSRVAVMAALILADELARYKTACERHIQSLESEGERLLELMNNALKEEDVTLPDS